MVGAIVLAMIYGYLFFEYRYRYLAFWSAAWGFYAIPAMIDGGLIPLSDLYFNLFSLAACFSLARGMMAHLSSRHPTILKFKRPLLFSAVAAGVLMVLANLAGLSSDWQLAPTYVFLSLAFVSMGTLLLLDVKYGVANLILGAPLLMLGLSAFAAIFVLPEPVEMALLLVMGISLPTLAIGMLVAFVDYMRRDVLESQKKARREIEESLDEAQENYRFVVEQQTVGVGIVDLDENFTFSNPAADTIMGVERGQLVGRNLREFTDQQQFALVLKQTQLRRTGQASTYEINIRQPGGRQRRVLISSTPRHDRNGNFVDTLGVFQDVTEQREARTEIQRLLGLERLYRLQAEILQEATRDLISNLDLDEVLGRVMDNLRSVIQYDSVCLFLYQDGKNFVQAVANRGFPNPEKVTGITLENNPLAKLLEERRVPVILEDAQADPRFAKVGDAEHVRGWIGLPLIFRDQMIGFLSVDSRKVGAYTETDARLAQAFADQAAIAIQNSRLYESVERLAATDPLTGIFNRRSLFERAKHEFDRYLRYQTPVAVVMIDIDHFRRVNNTYGHQVGDDVLRQVASRLQNSIRQVDLIGRYGGEEFMVMLTDLDHVSVKEIADRLGQSISETPIQVEHNAVAVTLSIGVAIAHPSCATLDDLIYAADKALYMAKAAGRNCVYMWTPES